MQSGPHTLSRGDQIKKPISEYLDVIDAQALCGASFLVIYAFVSSLLLQSRHHNMYHDYLVNYLVHFV